MVLNGPLWEAYRYCWGTRRYGIWRREVTLRDDRDHQTEVILGKLMLGMTLGPSVWVLRVAGPSKLPGILHQNEDGVEAEPQRDDNDVEQWQKKGSSSRTSALHAAVLAVKWIDGLSSLPLAENAHRHSLPVTSGRASRTRDEQQHEHEVFPGAFLTGKGSCSTPQQRPAN